jgi:hypothetical protein
MKLRATNFLRTTLFFCAISFIGFVYSAGATNTISVPTDFLIAQGQTGAVPVTATFTTGATPVGIDFTLQYDSNVIEVFSTGSSAVQMDGNATEGWNKEHNVVTVSGSTKEIRISAAANYASEGLPPGTSTLFNIVFQAVSTADTMSSPLTITLADINEIAVLSTDGSVKLTGATGVLTLSPDPVKPGRNVVVELTDQDLDTSGAAEVVSVTINSRATSGGTIKETQTVILTETGGATGVFTGGFTTTYGATGIAGGAFEVIPGDFLDGEYTDTFDSTGVGDVITDAIQVVVGVTGVVTTSPASLSAGATLTVTVDDADLDDPDANDETVEVSVVRFVAGDMIVVDTELLTVSADGIGVTIPTSSSAGASGDNTLNVGAGDQLVAKYDDPLGSTGAMVPGLLSINPVVAVFDNVPSSLEVRAPLSFDLLDSDIFGGTRIPGGSEVEVEIVNSTTGESEVLSTSSSSDPFIFTIATIFSNASSTSPHNNGALGIKPGDTVVAKYTDRRDDVLGDTLVVTSTNILVAMGTTGTVSTSPDSITAGDSLTVTLTDDDLAGNIAGIYAGDVTLIVRRNGVDIILQDIVADLVETPPGSGIFIATIPTGGLGLLPGDRLLVSYDDAVNGSGVPENNVLSIPTDDGSFDALPASIAVGDSLPIVLNDTDMQQPTYVIGIGSLNAVAKNLSNGDTETVTLIETAANSGIFTYSVTTVFTTGATAPNSGDLEVQPGDFLQVVYVDPRGASGIQTEIVSTIVEVLGGGDGTATVSPSPSFSVGSSISVTVIDEDLGNSGNIDVTLRSTRSGSTIETETLTLSAAGSGFQFIGSIATSFASGSTSGSGGVGADDLILQLQAGDKVRVEYLDAITSGGGSATVVSGSTEAAGGTTGSIIVSRLLEGGDVLRIEVTDADLNVNFGSVDSTIATVCNLTNGDQEDVLLTETGISTGVFRAGPTEVTASGAASGDGTVQVNPHDTLKVSYTDLYDVSGGSQALIDSVYGLKWGDNSDNNKLGALDASQILQYTVQNVVFSSYQTAVSNVDGASYLSFGEVRDITALDAVYVLKRIVGLISEFPVQSMTPDPHPYKKSVDQRLLAFGEAEQMGNSLKLPILLDETRDVVSGMLKLNYDPTQYRVSAVKTSEATEGYLIASRIEAGSVWVALAGAQSQHTGEAAVIEVELEAIGATTEQPPMVLEEATFNGGWIQAVAVERPSPAYEPRDFSLSPNFPNPFNPETTLRYALPQSGSVKLTIYDMLGQEIRALVNEVQAPGMYTVLWNGRNDHGFAVASGLYFYRIEVGNFIQTRKMTLVR